jgi:REP element-mobilizing transposase RayT
MRQWNDNGVPIAYFISFRARGTWLHGDKRGSVSRHHSAYGSPYLPAESNWHAINRARLKVAPVKLSAERRQATIDAIKETCRKRDWLLDAVNIRTNHVHTVVRIGSKSPDIALNAFKANATRTMRERRLWGNEGSPWADKGSKRRLWTDHQVAAASAYVLYEQGDPLPGDEG